MAKHSLPRFRHSWMNIWRFYQCWINPAWGLSKCKNMPPGLPQHISRKNILDLKWSNLKITPVKENHRRFEDLLIVLYNDLFYLYLQNKITKEKFGNFPISHIRRTSRFCIITIGNFKLILFV